MNRLSDLMYYQGAHQDNPLMGLLSEALYNNAPQQNPNGLLMLAQATPKAGMQKQIIENDPELYGPRPVAPAVAPGPSFKGQVGTTVMPSAQEASLRSKLRERGLPADQIDAMVLQHKAAQGLR